MHSSPAGTHSWPLTFSPQWTWTMKTWMTSWTTTGSVLYPCPPSLKLHQEVPKKKKGRISRGAKTSPSVILALSLSSVLQKLLMAQQGTKTTGSFSASWSLIVHSVYLTYFWSDCEWIVLHRPLLYTLVGSGLFRTWEQIWRKCLYFSKLLKKGYVSKVALSKPLDEKQLLTCLFSGEAFCLSVGWLCEGTQGCFCEPHRWNVKLWLCNDYHSLLSHRCKWCTIIQWMEARYLE